MPSAIKVTQPLKQVLIEPLFELKVESNNSLFLYDFNFKLVITNCYCKKLSMHEMHVLTIIVLYAHIL